MNHAYTRDDQASLRHDLRQARAKLDQRVDDLRKVDGDLRNLELDRRKFELLRIACGALTELDELGSSALFWSARDTAMPAGDPLRLVRSRVDEYEKQLALVEERRQSILDELQMQQDCADSVAGSLLDVERLEEERQREWQIEREIDRLPIRESIMPWAASGDDDRLYRKTLARSLFVSALATLLMPFVEIPLPEHWEILDAQEPFTARLVPDALTPPELVLAAKPIETIAPERSDGPAVFDDSDAAELADDSQEGSGSEPAAAQGGGSAPGSGSRSGGGRGLMAFREKFSDIATADAVERLGSNARIDDPSGIADGPPERSLVTSNAPGSSGGIELAALSRGTGGTGTALSGLAIERATSTLGTGTGAGGRGNGNGTGVGDGTGSGTGNGYRDGSGNGNGTGTSGGNGRGNGTGRPGSGALHARSDEEIQIVFDRHKAVLYRLYNRELRQNPTLKGQMVLRLTIQSDGSVSLCEVKSTDMKAPQLAAQVVERVKTFDFGAKPGILPVTIVYPIDFLPAT